MNAMRQQVTFPSGTVSYYFNSSMEELPRLCDNRHVVFVTDANIAGLYPELFSSGKALVLPAGESAKDIGTITALTGKLLEMGATRDTLLVGVGGGVITDITGFLASVFMRGIAFGFLPTTLLAMVDAAIGGKNGVNMGLFKNIIGTIRQPQFILYDTRFLKTLPADEWSNGFAEIIKYACIFDSELFDELSVTTPEFYRDNAAALDSLVARCAAWKNITVAGDEQEAGVRKLLNFGHTVAHAIENLYHLPHGKAVSIGMVLACQLSEEVAGLDSTVTHQLIALLQRYNLPVHIPMDQSKVMAILKADKKRKDETIDYILLTSIGNAVVKPLSFPVIEKALANHESDH